MTAALALIALLAVVAALAALRDSFAVRRDLRRLTERIARGDAESVVSIGVDSFGAADELASRIGSLRVNLARALSASEWQQTILRHILNGIGEGVLAIDDERRVVLANRRFTDLFGISSGFSGRPLNEVIRYAAVFEGFDGALTGTESIRRFAVPGAGGERRVEMRAFALPSQSPAAAALFIDVTDLERLEQMRRDFIADFTHEARTPLAALRSAVDTYEVGSEQMSVEEDHQLRRIMLRQTLRLQRLVDDLAELSSIESGDVRLERGSVDLRRLVDDLAEDFADRAAQKRQQITVEGRACALGDALRLQQAFSNLIDNAIKYGAEESTVDIDILPGGDAAVVRITDHGEGIAPEERDRVFRRFYRVDKSRSQDIAGAGLGLAITKHLVQRMGGSITVTSEVGGGSTFEVSLPIDNARRRETAG